MPSIEQPGLYGRYVAVRGDEAQFAAFKSID
jgi:hypothetical protein